MNNKKVFIKTMAATIATAGIVAYLPAEKASADTPTQMQKYYDEKMSKAPIVLENSKGEALGNISELYGFYYNAKALNPNGDFPIVYELGKLLEKQTNEFYKKYTNTLDNGTYQRIEDRGQAFDLAVSDIHDGFSGSWFFARVKSYYIQSLLDETMARKDFKTNYNLQYDVAIAENFLLDRIYDDHDKTDRIIKSLEAYVGKAKVKEADNKYLQQLRKDITNNIAEAKKKNEKEVSSVIKPMNTEVINLLEKESKKELTFERALILKALTKKQLDIIANYKYVISTNLVGIERIKEVLKSNIIIGRTSYKLAQKQYINYVINKAETYLKTNNYTLDNSQNMLDFIVDVWMNGGYDVPNSFVVSSAPVEKHMTYFGVDESSKSIATKEYKSIKINAQQASNATPTTVTIQYNAINLEGVLMMKSGNAYTPVGYTNNDGEIKVKVTRSGELAYVVDAVVPLKDIKGNFFEKEIRALSNRAIVSGYANKFEPDKYSTRAEFFTMLANGLGVTQNVKGTFKDAKGKWYDGVTSTLAELGYVHGSYGNVNGDKTITRQDAFAVIGRLLENEGFELPEVNLSKFKDADKVAEYAAPYIQLLMDKKIVAGGMDGNLDPEAKLTKGQMAKVLTGVLYELEYMDKVQ